MSDAVLTDSITATVSPAFTLRPTSGSSTNTTSPSWSCAWSVMPTVTTPPPSWRTHSCDLAYLRSSGVFMLLLLHGSYLSVYPSRLCHDWWKGGFTTRAAIGRPRTSTHSLVPSAERFASTLAKPTLSLVNGDSVPEVTSPTTARSRSITRYP